MPGPLFALDFDQPGGFGFSQHGCDAVQRFLCSGPDPGGPIVAAQFEVDPGQHQGQAPHPVGDVPPFGPLALEELAARGNLGEQFGDFDPGSRRSARSPFAKNLATLEIDRVALVAVARPGVQPELRNRSDGRQGLTPKAKARDVLETGEICEFAGGMSSEGHTGFPRGHSVSVVCHRDQGASAIANIHSNSRSSRVERVLDQLLDHRCRPLDNLAGGDLVDQFARKQLDPAILIPHVELRLNAEN